MRGIKAASFAAAALSISVLAGQTATAEQIGSATSSLRLQAYVPTICRVQLSLDMGRPDDRGVVSLGDAEEFCNAPRGYRVVISHAQNLTGAAILRDGVRIPLSASGETVLTDSTHADARTVRLSIDPGATRQPLGSVSVRIEAKA